MDSIKMSRSNSLPLLDMKNEHVTKRTFNASNGSEQIVKSLHELVGEDSITIQSQLSFENHELMSSPNAVKPKSDETCPPKLISRKINQEIIDPVRRVIKITEIIEINNSSQHKNLDQEEIEMIKRISNSKELQTKSIAHETFNESKDDDKKHNPSFKASATEPIYMKSNFKMPTLSESLRNQEDFEQLRRKNECLENEIKKMKDKVTKSQIMYELIRINSEKLAKITKLKEDERIAHESKENYHTIPVVHNFSFINKEEISSSNGTKPKKILIKITGRTRSVSIDKHKLSEEHKPQIYLNSFNQDQPKSKLNFSTFNKNKTFKQEEDQNFSNRSSLNANVYEEQAVNQLKATRLTNEQG